MKWVILHMMSHLQISRVATYDNTVFNYAILFWCYSGTARKGFMSHMMSRLEKCSEKSCFGAHAYPSWYSVGKIYWCTEIQVVLTHTIYRNVYRSAIGAHEHHIQKRSECIMAHIGTQITDYTCISDAQWVMAHIILNESWHLMSCHTCEWVMAHMWMSHGTHVNESCHTYEWVMSHMWMSHVTHVNESCHTCEWVMSHMW